MVSYTQTPYETITAEQFLDKIKHLHSLDLSKVIETVDNTDLKGEVACAGGISCEVI